MRRVIYRLPRPTPDGRTVLSLSPHQSLEALAHLIPPPRRHDELRVFSTPAVEGRRLITPGPLDVSAVLTFSDGRARRHEFYHGSTYLSHSSRRLRVPPGVERIVIHDSHGETRTVTF